MGFAFFAFCLWGGWSFYVNAQSSGLKVGLVSGLVQGFCSFIITLFIGFLIEKQFNFYQKIWLKLILPPIITILISGSCLVFIHLCIATPHIVKTISPAITVAFIFACLTNIKLYRQQKID
ncbi:hypothetical protein I2F62_00440 [Acinetobacter sp. MD2(2019)]|nr:hypothetical protein [Acinetobacter sp. MD2(2019)]